MRRYSQYERVVQAALLRACFGMHLDGCTMEDAMKYSGLSRYQIRRRLKITFGKGGWS